MNTHFLIFIFYARNSGHHLLPTINAKGICGKIRKGKQLKFLREKIKPLRQHLSSSESLEESLGGP